MKDLFWLCNLSQSQLTEACGLTANYSEIGIERKFFFSRHNEKDSESVEYLARNVIISNKSR